MFNKKTNWTLNDWKNSDGRYIMLDCPIDYSTTEFVDDYDMSDEEKRLHPEYTTIGGYLKKVEVKADRQQWWDNLRQRDKDAVMYLPNFNAKVFKDCTGITVQVLTNDTWYGIVRPCHI